MHSRWLPNYVVPVQATGARLQEHAASIRAPRCLPNRRRSMHACAAHYQGFRRDDLPKIDARVREECAGVRGVDATAGTTWRSFGGTGR